MMFIPNMWTGEQAPPPLPPPWEADTISCGNRFDWKFERAAALSSSPGAEGTDSPPRHPFSDSAEILRISGRGICKEAIFSPGGKLPSEKISTIPPHRSPGSIGSREGSHPLELSETVLARILVSDDAGAILLNAFVSDGAGRGALRSPTPPRVTGCERVATLSRSPGGDLAGTWFSDDTGAVLLTAFVFDDAGYF